MTVKTRFLVLDRTNNAMRPCDHGFHGPGLQSDKSPSFEDLASAELFGNFLAKRYVGQRFYVAEIKKGAVQYTDPAPAAAWVDATVTTAEE